MIQALDLVKNFGRLKVLDNVNLHFQKGECVAILGPNGSGKTTFIKCILGMVVPSSGEILFDNISISKDCNYRSNIGYMPQIGNYPENMTIGQIISMMKDIRQVNTEQLDEELIVDFKLTEILNKRMNTLSGGTRQKVSASLAFLFNSSVLILDEPTAGLDPLASEILKNKICREKNKGKLILITSHVLSELDEIASQVAYLFEGKVKFHKSIEELKAETNENKLSKAIARIMSVSSL
mgnify:CR=1 FL=1